MDTPQSSRFWCDALKSGLIDEPALMACWEAIPPDRRVPDAIDRRLARRTVDSGRLTSWQATQILAGRPGGLAVGRYVLLDVLGQGGMGRVYLARDARLNRPVALKILAPKGRANPRSVERFLREARVGARLQHDNLVRIYDEGESQGSPFLVMEYIEGKPLGRLLSEFGPMPPSTAARLARQVALGLDHLHLKGLVHRDVNPWNILVTPEGVAKLADLGLALDSSDDVALTVDGATVGTFDYMSPEQARHSRAIDSRSDIYSLGCTLYQMVTGRIPFDRLSLPEKLLAHLSEEPAPPRSLAPEVPEGLEAVILKMMSKSPKARYPAPSAVVQALEPFLGNRTIGLASSYAAMPPTESTSTTDSVSGFGAATASAGNTAESVSLPFSLLGRSGSWVGQAVGGRLRIGGGRPALIGIAALATVLAALLWASGPRAWPPWSGGRSGGLSGTASNPEAPDPPRIRVVRPDGSSVRVDDLAEALELAGSGDLRIELAGTAPVRLERSQPLEVVQGSVTIVAAEGSRPVLVAVPTGSRPFFVVRPRAHLRLEELEIRVEYPGRIAKPPPLIESNGRLELRRCSLRATSPVIRAPAIVFDGPALVASGCWFEGFSPILDLDAFAGFEARLEHCMLIGAGSGDPESSWAIRVGHAPSASADATCRLAIRHCTVRSPCLLKADDFSRDFPLSVAIERTRVLARGLLVWNSDSSPTPENLAWSGRDNRYEIADSLLVYDLSRPPSDPSQPIGWDGLTRTWEELDSEILPPSSPRPPDRMPGRPLLPEDFPQLVERDGMVGADPRLVGPREGRGGASMAGESRRPSTPPSRRRRVRSRRSARAPGPYASPDRRHDARHFRLSAV